MAFVESKASELACGVVFQCVVQLKVAGRTCLILYLSVSSQLVLVTKFAEVNVLCP